MQDQTQSGQDTCETTGRFGLSKERLVVRGQVKVRKNGEVVYAGENLIVTAGLNLLASIIGASGTKPSHMAIGASGTATASAQTALQGTEHERVSITTSVVDNSVTYSATLGSGITGSVSIKEFGIFNAASAGTMLARFVILELTADSSDSLDVDWSITIEPTS